MSRYSRVPLGPPIEGSALRRAYEIDNSEMKVNLSGGDYSNEEGLQSLFPIVRRVKKKIARDVTLSDEYLPVLGLEAFNNAATHLLLGEESSSVLQQLAFSVQCLGGTGAMRVGAEFLNNLLQFSTFYYSTPSIEKHRNIFLRAGFTVARQYHYWNHDTHSLDLDYLLSDLNEAPKDAVIILQACGHNPTGCDPTPAQWMQIADVMEKNQLFPFFDSYCQGLASGNIEKDSWAIRYFAARGFEMMCSQSFSTNFGLYNERIGSLTVVVNNTNVIVPIRTQLTLIVRDMFSSPSSHGARIVAMILNNYELFEDWKNSVKDMSNRILEMRQGLQDSLERAGTPGRWNHLTSQMGMFSYTQLTPQQVEYLLKICHIYLSKNGSINICGLNTKNLQHVANSINEAVLRYPNKEDLYSFEKEDECVM